MTQQMIKRKIEAQKQREKENQLEEMGKQQNFARKSLKTNFNLYLKGKKNQNISLEDIPPLKFTDFRIKHTTSREFSKEVSISPHSFQKKLNRKKAKNVVNRNFNGIYEKDNEIQVHIEPQVNELHAEKMNESPISNHKMMNKSGHNITRCSINKNQHGNIPNIDVKLPSQQVVMSNFFSVGS